VAVPTDSTQSLSLASNAIRHNHESLAAERACEPAILQEPAAPFPIGDRGHNPEFSRRCPHLAERTAIDHDRALQSDEYLHRGLAEVLDGNADRYAEGGKPLDLFHAVGAGGEDLNIFGQRQSMTREFKELRRENWAFHCAHKG
jgi:hypothetical protein